MSSTGAKTDTLRQVSRAIPVFVRNSGDFSWHNECDMEGKGWQDIAEMESTGRGDGLRGKGKREMKNGFQVSLKQPICCDEKV